MAGRYHRQEAVAWFGPDGQAALARASLLVVGVGATGSQLLALLVRAGAGRIRFADDDRVSPENLHRQQLYAEPDIGQPKVAAAAARCWAINGAVVLEPRESRFTAETAPELLAGIDLVLDGTDNFAARFCINAHCLAAGIPWVYSGVAGDEGVSAAFAPGGAPCFRCFLPEAPPPGAVPDTVANGILGPTVALTAAFSTMRALRILCGQGGYGTMLFINSREGTTRTMVLDPAPECSACGRKQGRDG